MQPSKGFDASQYPGVNNMRVLRRYFDFCGFYLGPAPSHRDTGWMSHRDELQRMGYRLMPIYVGQQVIGPGSHDVSGASGAQDGAHAAGLMASAGFAKGLPIYLDLENGDPFPPKERSYAFAWIDAVRQHGYAPGVYCSHVLADHFDPAVTHIWAFKIPTARRTYVDLSGLELVTAGLEKSWTARQFRQNVVLRPLGITVDLDIAAPDAGGLVA